MMQIKDLLEYKGIGKKKIELLKKINIFDSIDLIYHFPNNYIDLRKTIDINDIFKNPDFEKSVLIRGKILRKESRNNRGKKNFIKVTVSDKSGTIDIQFFNSQYLDILLKKYEEYYFYGKVNKLGNYINLIQPKIIETKSYEPIILGEYLLPKGLNNKEIRRVNKEIIENFTFELLPSKLISENRLLSIKEALNAIHFPKNKKEYLEGKKRIVYQELFFLELGFYMSKSKFDLSSYSINPDSNKFVENLDFDLTISQKKAIDEILDDMSKPNPMNRLLQGDVGSGKTVVATAACYNAIKDGFQGSILVPTEILARQHYNTTKPLFDKLGYRVGLLVGNMKVSERKNLIEDLKAGEIDLLIGTHAILEKDVEFKKLGIVVTDEQHRFGVKQRLDMKNKGKYPHTLVMTATPIPRTLGVIFYGNLDMSIIDSMPKGRKKIISKVIVKEDRKKLYLDILKNIERGEQGYIVAPLISDSENLEELLSVESIYKELSSIYKSKNIKIAVIHGAMTSKEKDEIMSDFLGKKIDLLISTVVIEVGINVPNATLMIIENAERFGLAQLHQLRGRIGRGNRQSYCYFISDLKTDRAKERLKIMQESSDGFYIAEKDLELRGPGEIFGLRQHGSLDEKLKLAIKHLDILKKVKEDIKNYEDEINSFNFTQEDRFLTGYCNLNL